MNKPSNSHSGHLPILSQVSIKTPCPMKWDQMQGDASQRYCDQCKKHVHDFSEMDSGSVNELLKSERSVCAKIRRRPDGTIITKDSNDSSDRPILRRTWFTRISTLTASVAAILTLGGCREKQLQETTGIVAPLPTAQAPELLGEIELGDVEIEELPTDKPASHPPQEILGRVGPIDPAGN